jgi:hypothetical protein
MYHTIFIYCNSFGEIFYVNNNGSNKTDSKGIIYMTIKLIFQNIAGNKLPHPLIEFGWNHKNLQLVYDFLIRQDEELIFTAAELMKRFNFKWSKLMAIAQQLTDMELLEYEEIKDGDRGDIILFFTTV